MAEPNEVKPAKAKPIIKVYNLPPLRRTELENLHHAIAGTAIRILDGYELKGEEDLIVLFVPNETQYSSGPDVLIEVDLPTKRTLRHYMVLREIAGGFGGVVKQFCPNSFVQCVCHHFEAEAQSWTS